MATTATLKLVLEVDLDLNGADVDAIQQNLSQIVAQAIENGVITQATSAEIEDYRTAVVDASAVSDPSTQDDIEAYLVREIENGNQDSEGIPLRMARWGLMDPAEFAADMLERIKDEETDGDMVGRPTP